MIEKWQFEEKQEIEFLFKIWSDSLSLADMNLESSLASELAEYLGVPVESIRNSWISAVVRIKKEWQESHPTREEEIIQFYDTNTTQLLESMYWHSQVGHAIVDNVRALKLAGERSGRRYLDFGCGVGSNGILFARHGFEVTLADISSVVLNFAMFRLKKRGLKADFIDLKVEKLPKDYFDFVTAIHTLEHTTDPVTVFATLVEITRPGGIIFVSCPFWKDEERPMHVVTDMGTADKFLDFNVVQLPQSGNISRIYQKIV